MYGVCMCMWVICTPVQNPEENMRFGVCSSVTGSLTKHELGCFVLGFFVLFCFGFGFMRQDFPVALEPVLELALVDQAGLALTEIHLPLPAECWN